MDTSVYFCLSIGFFGYDVKLFFSVKLLDSNLLIKIGLQL